MAESVYRYYGHVPFLPVLYIDQNGKRKVYNVDFFTSKVPNIFDEDDHVPWDLKRDIFETIRSIQLTQ